MKIAQTKNCNLADSELTELTKLNIDDAKFVLGYSQPTPARITRITGIADSSSVSTESNLQKVDFLDLEPLTSLVNLEELSLEDNQISNIKSLTGMKSLKDLSLNGNRIQDLKPLANLTAINNIDRWSLTNSVFG